MEDDYHHPPAPEDSGTVQSEPADGAP
jgi:hypothetical protein